MSDLDSDNKNELCKAKENKVLKTSDFCQLRLKIEIINYFYLMSGDNMLGEQPLKFYTEEATETKIQLVNHLLIMNAQRNKIIDLDRIQKENRSDLAS